MARRWIVLASFSILAGFSQLLGLNFVSLVSFIENRYSVTESQAGLLILVSPLIYMLLSLPAGAIIDRKGYYFSAGAGAICLVFFSLLRCTHLGFYGLLAAQIGIAIAQPFIVNSISKLVLEWFDKSQEALANGIGTMGMFIGMAIGIGATAPLVGHVGFAHSMMIYAALTILVAVVFLSAARPRMASSAAPAPGLREFKLLLSNPKLLLLFALAFLGLGFFNGLTTWIEPIFKPNGMDSVQAGAIGGVLVLAGIAGSGLIPAASDLIKRQKPFLLGCILIALLTWYPFSASSHYSQALWLAGVQGFFFLPAFALLLATCSQISGEAMAGAATGILMLCGNAGAVLMIVVMEAIKTSGARPFEPGVHLLFASLLIAFVGACFVPETHPQRPRI